METVKCFKLDCKCFLKFLWFVRQFLGAKKYSETIPERTLHQAIKQECNMARTVKTYGHFSRPLKNQAIISDYGCCFTRAKNRF